MRPSTLELFDPTRDPHDREGGAPRIETYGVTDVGCRRRSNEDSFLIADLRRWMMVEHSSAAVSDGGRLIGAPQGKLLAVADGMGGHGGGDVASRVAVDALAHHVMSAMAWPAPGGAGDAVSGDLAEAMRRSQERLRAVVQQMGIAAVLPGTTLTIAFVLWPALYVAHVGDSRCYLQRDNRLMRLTTDHTVAQRLYETDVLDESELERSPLRHTLFNAVGGGSEELHPDIARFELVRGDALLLCTDGLTGHLSDAELLSQLRARRSAAECCHRLVDTVKERGALDNVTVLIARVAPAE
jgi:PPM family protein phosphatase